MIIIQLNGGLGNQFYQYALARKLALKNKTILKIDLVKYGSYTPKSLIFNNQYVPSKPTLFHRIKVAIPSNFVTKILNKGVNLKKKYYSLIDIGYYREDIKRFYTLHNFNIKGQVLSLLDFLFYRINNKIVAKLPLFNKNLPYNLVTYPKEDFNPNLLTSGKNTYLIGFFQSFKYFKDIRGTLLKDFKAVTPTNKYNENMIQKIKSLNVVSMHVRRGDYVAQDHVNKTHGTCSPQYYINCIDYIKQNVNNPYFLVFSDDIEWAKANMKTGCPTDFSENLPEQDYEDIRLMYNCKHFIIANSTFSWWGAWLSENPDKIVCAPNKWFNDKVYNIDDIIPAEWIKFD